MQITPDEIVLWQWGPLKLNATIAFTWLLMALLCALALWARARLSSGVELGRGQNLLEVVVDGIRRQIEEVAAGESERLLPFIGTLFVFIAASNLLAVVPYFRPPTGSLSTAAALAACVFVAVPVFGVAREGWREYLSHYTRPSVLMLPFNVLGELSRTLALAVRLFGNVMSGTLLAGILLALAPLFLPILMQALGLLTGLVQAYVFAILALIYVASANASAPARQAPPRPAGTERPSS